MSFVLLLSPAKKQSYGRPDASVRLTKPRLLADTDVLVRQLRSLSATKLAGALGGVSQKLAELNHQRYQDFVLSDKKTEYFGAAMYTFSGDVYRAFEAHTVPDKHLAFMQQHIRLLSGLYGLLRPLDVIQYHRLEMGCGLSNERGKDLYAYWQSDVSRLLNKDVGSSGCIVNCASQEYVKAVDRSLIKSRWIDVVFKQVRNGTEKSIGILSKRARGQMARYAIDRQSATVEDLQQFKVDGYCFDRKQSSDDRWVFISKQV